MFLWCKLECDVIKNVIFDKIKINKVLFDKNVKFYINILIYVMILEV